MLDNSLIRLFLPIIQNGLILDGYEGVTVKQANQPTQQGINTGPTVYFFKVGDRPIGLISTQESLVDTVLTDQTLQWYETTFRISALVLQDPASPSYTASDLINEVRAIMQSQMTVETLILSDVSILRVTDVSNQYFKDDRDQFEAIPSFDFTLTHMQNRVEIPNVVSTVESGIYPI